jgi:hypothetical protein
MNKKRQRQIEKKLDQLSELLDNITAVQTMDANDFDTWDSDTLYSLVEDLKEALQLLEDKETNQRNEYGEPIILETGLCSLMDDWEAQREEEEDD